jgi:pimeloyl-ACP methyl ester carboxylesterase
MKELLLLLFIPLSFGALSQDIQYLYPVSYLNFQVERQEVKMAFMDVKPPKPNGETVMLFHGKNFNGYYWKDVIKFLADEGFRVIVPDQIGWGKSTKPLIHYSFFSLASNNARLLDSLRIEKVYLVAHSMGGMLATRFSTMFPQKVKKLVLENPIGLEDYSAFVPYASLEELHKGELKQTYESLKKYQQSYYPTWKDEYEQYVKAQAAQFNDSNFYQTAYVNALTYQMIYEQPVVHSFDSLKIPTLLIIGQEDRTIVGKNRLNDQQKKAYGNYPELGKKINKRIPGSKLVLLPGVGHIPHIQEPAIFKQTLLGFLTGKTDRNRN